MGCGREALRIKSLRRAGGEPFRVWIGPGGDNCCLRPNKIARSGLPGFDQHNTTPITIITAMDKRTTESPMDFEWQSKAPGDVTSPFYQLSMQHDNQKKSG